METVRSTGAQMDINQDSLRSLAEIPLNGRQVSHMPSVVLRLVYRVS